MSAGLVSPVGVREFLRVNLAIVSRSELALLQRDLLVLASSQVDRRERIQRVHHLDKLVLKLRAQTIIE